MPPIRVQLRRFFTVFRHSLPPIFFVGVALAFTVDLLRNLAPLLWKIANLFAQFWEKQLPKWAYTLVGLFLVVVVLGLAVVPLYGVFEAFILWLRFGGSSMGARLRRLARQDLLLSIDAIQQDTGITRPYAVLLALIGRIGTLPSVIRSLDNVQNSATPVLFEKTIQNIRQGWTDGLQASILIHHLRTLGKLPVVREEDRLRGRIVISNITYLLGDLWEGRRLADKAITDAQRIDTGRLPVYQWLASYAHANSRLFLGSFDEAATLLGQRWRETYFNHSLSDRETLLSSLRSLSTLNPLASVGRHIILASAFAGKALRKRETEPHLDSSSSNAEWARRWYTQAVTLAAGEQISEDFARAYMALYCLTVEQVYDCLQELALIPAESPPVSQYAKSGVRGLVMMGKKRLDDALEDLRRADSYSRLSGNRFLEGVLLPAHAAVSARVDLTRMFEAWRILKRARTHAALARSAFYDSQVDAAAAVIASVRGKDGEKKKLWERAQRTSHGLLFLYEPLLSEASRS